MRRGACAGGAGERKGNVISIGVDLAGPRGAERTALVAAQGENVLEARCGWTDAAIVEFVAGLNPSEAVAIGLDAPLSYNEQAGQRAADAELRKILQEAGLHPGSVMAPLAPQMVYLTLRGIALGRALEGLERESCRLVEVHPAAFMVLNGASAEDVRGLKVGAEHRARLWEWLRGEGLRGLPIHVRDSDHLIAAASAALAAQRWAEGRHRWISPANPPLDPYDFSC